ncbi:MAG: glycerol-3-phosphate dehydrogenase subunit GlpB, partial [Caldilineae bacterium]
MAAARAAARGLRVKVIAKGMGATHWHAGTVDVLGYDGAGRPVHRPFDSLAG